MTSLQAESLHAAQAALSDDAMEGRATGTAGGRRSADWIEGRLRTTAMTPGGTVGFRRPFRTEATTGPAKGTRIEGANLAAWRRGASDRWVVVGAHFDHVGRNGKGPDGPVFNGADDNGSGSAILLGLAEVLPRLDLKRGVCLAWFDGEEQGLLGSAAFVADPPVPLDRTDAMLNVDMVSRGDPSAFALLEVPAANRGLEAAAAAAERSVGARLDRSAADFLRERSDHWNFAKRGIPALFLFGGMHPDYHTERDDADRVNLTKLETAARVVLAMTCALADTEVRSPKSEVQSR